MLPFTSPGFSLEYSIRTRLRSVIIYLFPELGTLVMYIVSMYTHNFRWLNLNIHWGHFWFSAFSFLLNISPGFRPMRFFLLISRKISRLVISCNRHSYWLHLETFLDILRLNYFASLDLIIHNSNDVEFLIGV